MSERKNRDLANRWLTTAREDIDAAVVLDNGGKYAHTCFLSQQAAEKAVKALWFAHGEDPWGHSIQKLIREFPLERVRGKMKDHVHAASALDRFYIPTRYPNGLPDLTPGTTYFQQDAREALSLATQIIDMCDSMIEKTG